MIRASVEQLGFKFSDIKILLISHAHWDHDAGSAMIKQMTGAKYMVMDADVPVVESGGKTDFQYGDDADALYPPTTVDRVLHDGDEVKLGDAVLVAHLTPGHTKGCTTWTMKVKDGGKTYDVVIVGSPNVNPGYKLVGNALYPQIATDYERTFSVLKSLPVRHLPRRTRQLLRHGSQVRAHEGRAPRRRSSIPTATRNTSTSERRRFATHWRDSRRPATLDDSLVDRPPRRGSRGRTEPNAAAAGSRAESVADGRGDARAPAARPEDASRHHTLLRWSSRQTSRASSCPIAHESVTRSISSSIFTASRGSPSKPSPSLGDHTVAAVVNLGAGSGTYDRAFADPTSFDSLLSGVTREVVRGERAALLGSVASRSSDFPPDTAPSARFSASRATSRASTPCCCSTECTRLISPKALCSRTAARWTRRISLRSRTSPARRCVVKSDFSSRTRRSFPGTFASTTETADWMLRALGLRRTPVLRWGPRGMQQLSEVRSGKFEVLGFAGNSAPDHVDQFQSMPELLSRLLKR